MFNMKNLFKRIKGAKNNIATRAAKGTFISLLLSTCAAFTACTYEAENICKESKTTLQLKVGVNQPASRALIEGKTLPNGSQLGVSVVDNTGTAYQSQNYNNVPYTSIVDGSDQKWNTTTNVTLSGEEATLYAYYPYVDEVDITAIPINMAEVDQKDWMYATPVTGLSDSKSTAEVRLNHALTDLRLTFYKESYSGAGEVTEFTIQSTGMAVTGTLNAKTGEITLPATQVNTITRSADFTLTNKASATPIDVMLIPTGTEALVTVSVTVDGHTYSTSTTAFTLKKAKAYNYIMKLTSTGLEVTSVALTDWDEESLEDATFEPAGAGGEYSDWLKLTYTVTDASESTALFYIPAAPVSLMSRSVETFDISLVEGLIVQNKSITPALSHQFPEEGEYTVYVKFKDMSYIPSYAFWYCDELTGVSIPNSIETIGDGAFMYCSNLYEIRLSASVTSIGNEAFYGCCKRSSINVAAGNTVYDSRNDCNAIMETASNTLILGSSSTIIPDDCTEIERYAFFLCTELISVSIPNSVKTIGSSAFAYSLKLTEVIIGSGVTTIDYGAFDTCTELKKITSLAKVAPQIDYNTFSYIKSSGTLYVPVDATGYDTWTNNLSKWTMVEITESELFSFNIGSNTYQAEEGMTWAEWINSSYNTEGFHLEEDNGYILIKNDRAILAIKGSPVTDSDIINSTDEYGLWGSVIIPPNID